MDHWRKYSNKKVKLLFEDAAGRRGLIFQGNNRNDILEIESYNVSF